MKLKTSSFNLKHAFSAAMVAAMEDTQMIATIAVIVTAAIVIVVTVTATLATVIAAIVIVIAIKSQNPHKLSKK
jgi:hypothetical protein